ncbi:MAG: HAMP domain-containing protein, partial [Clostridiaceae bacterium]|nr:HAMP domain-containing protein [Clostridiaceae bacterium]
MRLWKGFLKLLRSLQWKLVYIFASMCILLVCVVYIVINSGLQTIYFDSFESDILRGYENWKDLRGISNSNEELLKYFRDNDDDKKYFGMSSDYLSMTVIDISQKNTNTRGVIYSTNKDYLEDPKGFGDRLLTSSTNLVSIWAGDQPIPNKELIKSKFISGSKYFEYIIQPEENENLLLYFTYEEVAWELILEKFNRLIFTSAIIAVFLSLLLGYLLSKTITSPIISVMHKAEKVAEGVFDEQLEVKSDDEIGNLTKTFNYMAKELKNTLS